MEYRKFGEKIYVRLDRGDEILASLISVCEKEGVSVAQIQGIGGCMSAAVGIFDTDAKQYVRYDKETMLELISLDGNVTRYEDKPYIHAHATFAYNEDGGAHTLTGHLLEAVIGLTGEIVITPADGRIGRRFIPETGIRIWDFED